MIELFALFMWADHDAGGGVNDLELIGSMDECVARAETPMPFDGNAAQIVRLPTLDVVKHRKLIFVESFLTAVPHSWRYEWVDGPPPK